MELNRLIQSANRWASGFFKQAALPQAVGHEVVPPVAACASTLKVLLVDDCELNRTLACAQLLRLSIEPTLACNGAQAVELVGSRHFDIVLMDISMPVMDGLEATARIRQLEQAHPERAHMPVVAYTAGAMANDPTALKRRGFDAVLRKPSNTRMVGACLQQVCGVGVK